MRILTIQFPIQHKGELTEVYMQLVHQFSIHLHSTVQQANDGDYYEADISTVKLMLNQANHFIAIEAIYPQFQLIKDGPIVYQCIANVLGKYIVEQFEADIIERLVALNSGSIKIDKLSISRYCHNILYHDPWGNLGNKYKEEDKLRRSNKIANEIEEFVQQESYLDISGFMTFRMSLYKKELTDVVEYAMDEFILDQQYEEFITLLKYFVQLQETKVELVHLIQQKGSSFALYNEQLKPLALHQEHDRIVAEMLETEINIEDIVISSLITASPQQIVIHAKHIEDQVIRTVKIIFGDRAQICSNCPLCREHTDEFMPLS